MTLPPFDRKVQLEFAFSRHVRRMDRCNLLLRKSAKNPLKGSDKTGSLRYRNSSSIGCFRERRPGWLEKLVGSLILAARQ